MSGHLSGEGPPYGPFRNRTHHVSLANQFAALLQPALKTACLGNPDKSRADALTRLFKQRDSLLRLIPPGVPDACEGVDSILAVAEEYIEAIYTERRQRRDEIEQLFAGLIGPDGKLRSPGALKSRIDTLRAQNKQLSRERRRKLGAFWARALGYGACLLGEGALITMAVYDHMPGEDLETWALSGLTTAGLLFGLGLSGHLGLGPLVHPEEDQPRFTPSTILFTLTTIGLAWCIVFLRKDATITQGLSEALAMRFALMAVVLALAIGGHFAWRGARQQLEELRPLTDEMDNGVRELRETQDTLVRIQKAEKVARPLEQAEKDLLARVTGNSPESRLQAEDLNYRRALQGLLETLEAMVASDSEGENEPPSSPTAARFSSPADAPLPNRPGAARNRALRNGTRSASSVGGPQRSEPDVD